MGGIVVLMPIRQRADSTPDLFASSPPGANAPERSPIPKGDSEPGNSATRPRPLLPTDLAGSLERLRDPEVDALLEAVTAEAKRRGRLPPIPQGAAPTGKTGSASRWAATDAGSLTTGKLNAVRAAFKAGVKPSAIARQFGISQADVKRALADKARRGTR